MSAIGAAESGIWRRRTRLSAAPVRSASFGDGEAALKAEAIAGSIVSDPDRLYLFQAENLIGGKVKVAAKTHKGIRPRQFFRRGILRDHLGRDAAPPRDLHRGQSASFKLFLQPGFYQLYIIHIKIL